MDFTNVPEKFFMKYKIIKFMIKPIWILTFDSVIFYKMLDTRIIDGFCKIGIHVGFAFMSGLVFLELPTANKGTNV